MATPNASVALTAARDVGPGPTVDFTTAVKNVSMVMSVTGTVDGGVVILQASHDGNVWVTMNALAPSSNTPVVFCTNALGAFRFWRANVVSLVTGGGTVDATLMEAG